MRVFPSLAMSARSTRIAPQRGGNLFCSAHRVNPCQIFRRNHSHFSARLTVCEATQLLPFWATSTGMWPAIMSMLLERSARVPL